jgi:hypothetical protein
VLMEVDLGSSWKPLQCTQVAVHTPGHSLVERPAPCASGRQGMWDRTEQFTLGSDLASAHR